MYIFDGSFTPRKRQTGRTHSLALQALISVSVGKRRLLSDLCVNGNALQHSQFRHATFSSSGVLRLTNDRTSERNLSQLLVALFQIALDIIYISKEFQKFAPFNFLYDQVRIVIGNDHFACVTFTFKEITGTA